MAVHYERIPSTDPRLARHIRHDDESRRYAYDTTGLSIVSAKHTRRIPVLDQDNYLDPRTGKVISLGSCTGNAGIGCLGTDPFYATVAGATGALSPAARRATEDGTNSRYSLDEAGAVQLYSDATKLDDYPGGYYAPGWQDTGSDGLSIAKALKNAGEISGYQHTFTLDDALKALGQTPVITGVNWYESMMNTDAEGRISPSGKVVGGHEIVLDEIDAVNEEVWGTQSWGPEWGVVRDGRPGRFRITFKDWGRLLSERGDVTIFVPLTSPAPTPTPPPTPPAPPSPTPIDELKAEWRKIVRTVEQFFKSLGG